MLPGFYRIIATCQRVAVKAGLLAPVSGPQSAAVHQPGAPLLSDPSPPALPAHQPAGQQGEEEVGLTPHARQQVEQVLAAYLQWVLASCRRFKVGHCPPSCPPAPKAPSYRLRRKHAFNQALMLFTRKSVLAMQYPPQFFTQPPACLVPPGSWSCSG
jgi:hypothetical protein